MSKRLTKVRKRVFPKGKQKSKVKKDKKAKVSKKTSMEAIRKEISETKWVSPHELQRKRITDSKRKKRVRNFVNSSSRGFPDNFVVWHSKRDQYEIVAFGDRIRDTEDSYFIGRTGEFID
jgi:ribosomal protein S25